ncbi:GH3 auxin-responsive promoter family protein [Limnofasciculus baicalensis]|uniref:GH3 auxin-responsive promoter family protein n=1 Tax=Limnofasciculus baicalensis BBK-W-15 TaxID=2699891 RepID=A0AAE3GLQ0_9CYAN|nr:GH3 auxin-responsive promoter family protein [Limnofasciculus baicalensis]MCP2726911.1 GH3 auxin-responsive promoter family protein [Limnofasciculus baicalensis BBK-W-15]
MTNYLFPLLTTVARYAKARFVQKTYHTEAAQEHFLLKLLQNHQDTELGRLYGLRDIKTINQFCDRVPILPYSSYEPYTNRIFQGEPNILTPDPVVYINLTSGSTGAKKLIPVTKRFQNSLKQANLASMGFLADALSNKKRKFGKLLLTNSVELLGRTPGGIEYGAASVGVLRMGKFLYEQIFTNPFETLLPNDSLVRHYICLLFALCNRNLRGVIANFPMLVLRICDYLERYGEELIIDLEKGTIANWLDLEPELISRLQSKLIANPLRAKELRHILNSEGRLTPKFIWPNLSFVATARGGTSDFYFERFPSYFGDTPVFGAVYSSAEATFSIYPDLDADGSILAIESGFFEFIPEDQWEAENPQTLLPTEVKVGEYYRLLVTNYSGFYRYDIGDVVEVVGFYNTAPLIVFRYRRGGILSATTEKTTEYHVTQVMEDLQKEFGVFLEDFCITLSENIVEPYYLVNIELRPGEKIDNPQSFIASFEVKLKEANMSYSVKRPNNFISPPRLRILAAGSFAIVRQRQLAKGVPDSQLKFPHISGDREFLAGLVVEREVMLPGDLN